MCAAPRMWSATGSQILRRSGEIYVNEKRLDEPYAKGRTSPPYGSRELEPHQYFLIGDNRDVSERYWKYDYQILGKVVF